MAADMPEEFARAEVVEGAEAAAAAITLRAAVLVPAASFVLAAAGALLAIHRGSEIALAVAAGLAGFSLFNSVRGQLTYAGREVLALSAAECDLDTLANRLAKKLVLAEQAATLFGGAVIALVVGALA